MDLLLPPHQGLGAGAGALAAFLLRTGIGWLRRPTTGLLAWVGLAALLATAVLYDSSTPFPGYAAALPVIATVLLIVGGAAPGSRHANRLLSLHPLQVVGAISYSLYLVHWPLQVIPQVAIGQDDPLPLWTRLLLGAVAFPLAWLLYRFVERPVIAWPVLRERSQLLTGAVAVTASVTLVATAAGVQWGTAQLETTTEQTVAETTELPTEPTGTEFVPTNLEPSLEEASSDNPEIYDNGCHRSKSSTDSSGCQVGDDSEAPLVFLFGDSHAASWYPALAALAAEGAIRLDTNTKSSCSSADVPLVLEGVDYVECDQWRTGVLSRIDQEQPDLVLLANYGAAEQDLEGGNEDYVARWQEGMESTIDAIVGPEVAIIADVPEQGETAAVCLSAHLDDARDCAAPRSTALDPKLIRAEQAAAEATGARYVDMTEYLCNDETCPTIIDNILVYRDGHHLTAEFSTRMARPLWEEIRVMID